MTTGSRVIDRRYIATVPPSGAATIGSYDAWNWNGGDAITAQKPRASYPEGYRRPKHLTKVTEKKPRKVLRLLPPKPYHKSYVGTEVSIYRYLEPGNNVVKYGTNIHENGVPPLPSSPDSGIYNKLLERVRRKAYGSGFNPAVFTAEGVEASKMIGDGAIRIRKAVQSLVALDARGLYRNLSGVSLRQAEDALKYYLSTGRRVGRTISGREALGGFSAVWLELQYGWLPLLSDVEAGARYFGFASTSVDPGPHNRIVVRERYERQYQPTRTFSSGVGFSYETVTDICECQIIIYRPRISSVFLPSLWTVASVAWERLPWSFVFDWFVPVGAYIESMRTADDVKGTVVTSFKVERSKKGVQSAPGYVFLGHVTGTRRHEIMEFDRQVTQDLVKPKFPVTVDSLGEAISSWKRALNATALLTQRAIGHLPQFLQQGRPL